MEHIEIKISSEDSRGVITDILEKEEIDSVTLIHSKKGSIRGNHFHKETVQWIYMLEGHARYVIQKSGAPTEEFKLTPGQRLRTDILEIHAMEALTDVKFIVMTRGPRAGSEYESDTFRVDPPLIPTR